MSTSTSTSTSTSIWLRDLMREVESQHALFGSTIFVLTSQVGTTTMEKWTRKRLQSQAQQQQQQQSQQHPNDNDKDKDTERRKLLMATSTATAQMMLTSEIESMLRYEIRSYHSTTSRSLREDNSNEIQEKKEDGNNGIHNDNGHDYLSVDDWIIIPMAPLDRTAMKDILLRRIAAVTDETTSGIGNTDLDKNSIVSNDYNPLIPSLSSFLLTESATDRLLDALEWHQWIHKTTGDVLRIWSPDGARPLFRLWKERILGTMRNRPECHQYHPTMNTSSSSSSMSVVQQHILDFEETTTEQFVIRSCVEMMADDNNNDSVNNDYYHDRAFMITTTDHRTWDCRLDNNVNGATTMKAKNAYSTCRFYL